MSHKVLCRFLYLSLWTKFFTKLLDIDNKYFLAGCVLLVWLYLYVIYIVKHDFVWLCDDILFSHGFGFIVWWYFASHLVWLCDDILSPHDFVWLFDYILFLHGFGLIVWWNFFFKLLGLIVWWYFVTWGCVLCIKW